MRCHRCIDRLGRTQAGLGEQVNDAQIAGPLGAFPVGATFPASDRVPGKLDAILHDVGLEPHTGRASFLPVGRR